MREENTYLGSPDNPRTAAYVSYITIIGWLIAYYSLYRRPNNFVLMHLRQSLMLHILAFTCNSLLYFLAGSVVVYIIVLIPLFILWITGVMHAISGQAKNIPLAGDIAQRLFKGIE
jgi:uncharacterized membrane protein